MENLLRKHNERRKIEQLVENRSVYASPKAELNIYETHQAADKVELAFSDPIFASMITGKKVMHLSGCESFDFLPGESVVLPSEEKLIIDFPEATLDNPTKCLALMLDPEVINETISVFNEKTITSDSKEWQLDNENLYLINDPAIDMLSSRLIFLFLENHPARDAFIDLLLKELVIRLMQSKARGILIHDCEHHASENRLADTIQYIRKNLTRDINVEQLSQRACMSKSHFFKCFKNTFGLSPIEFINKERIELSKKLLANKEKSVTDVCYEIGFSNTSYFYRLFKRSENITPKQFRSSLFDRNISKP